MGNVTAYDAKDCTILIDDVFMTGVGEDMISGEKDEEFFSSSVGAQGDVCNSEINNPLGTITLTLQATSPQKSMLLNYARMGKIFPIWVTNKNIGERFGGTKARIKNYPELAHGSEAEDREFEIAVFDYDVEGL